MKMNSQLTRTMSIFMLMIFSFVSCQKDDTSLTDSSEEQQEFASASSESDAEAQAIFDGVFDNVIGVNSEVAVGGTGVFAPDAISGNGSGPLSTTDEYIKCYVVTVTNLSANDVFPVQVVIDFGAGCTGRDGIVRKGKIITVYSKRLIMSGATATTTFDGYYVNGVHVEGVHEIKNTSANNQLSFEVEISDAKLSFENGNYIEWNSKKAVVQAEGSGTLLPGDDVFQVTGNSNGVTKRGEKLFQWSAEITSPLIKKFVCRFISQGSITFKKNNNRTAVLDYGNGSCDNKATISVGNRTLEITLR